MHNDKYYSFELLLIKLKMGLYFSDSIELVNYNLTTQDAHRLILAIKFNPYTRNRIRTLDLSNNNILALDIDGLANLIVLNVSFNSIGRISLRNLKNLKILQAECNRIERVNLHQLKNLTELNLYGNRLSKIDLSSCELLEKLNLKSNFLKQAFIDGFQHLQQVDLSNNNLKDLWCSATPLSKELRFSGHAMNSLSVINLISRKRAITDEQIIIDSDSLIGVEILQSDLFRISNDDLQKNYEAYMQHFMNNRIDLIMLGCQKIYTYLACNFGTFLANDVMAIIALYHFREQVSYHLKSYLNSMLNAVGTDQPERQAIFEDFGNRVINPKIDNLCKQAEVNLTTNKNLRAVSQRLIVANKPATPNISKSSNTLLWVARRATSCLKSKIVELEPHNRLSKKSYCI